MIFHMEDGVNPDNSEGDSSRDLAVCSGDVWCNISPAICNSNWDNRFEIVIDETKVEPDSRSHTDFPVLVSITGTDFTDNLDDVDDSINDIRFLDDAGALLEKFCNNQSLDNCLRLPKTQAFAQCLQVVIRLF